VNKLTYLFKFCYKLIFQFVSTVLLGFGFYKEKIEDKDKDIKEKNGA